MKTLEDFKARLAPGVALLCTAHTAFSGYVGKVREVTHAQRDGFWWRLVGEDDHLYWTRFPAASRCQVLDAQTVVLPGRHQEMRYHVTLRFVRDAPPHFTPEDWHEIYAALKTAYLLRREHDDVRAAHLERLMNTVAQQYQQKEPV